MQDSMQKPRLNETRQDREYRDARGKKPRMMCQPSHQHVTGKQPHVARGGYLHERGARAYISSRRL
jgi:hypothetical protein